MYIYNIYVIDHTTWWNGSVNGLLTALVTNGYIDETRDLVMILTICFDKKNC